MYTFPPIAAAVGAAYTVVTALAAVLAPVAGPAAAALAVVVLTAAVRLALLPLSIAQVRGEKVRTRLAPRMRELQRRHRADPQRLLTEQRRLYAEAGSSPMAGCLPALAQLPVFMVLYGVFTSPVVGGSGNELLRHTLGGVPLGSGLGDVLAGGGAGTAVFAVLLVVVAATAWASRRWLTLPALEGAAEAGTPAVPGARLMSFLPYGTVAAAAFLPLAAGLYLATTTAWTVAERLALRQLITG
ncbi:YidC/Oxa1 family membrane protein insertase [Streptomonospora litoralis]|uniref:Membrane protein insertase YidC n=1 Tax=Streptomonospora litoralis TaxID=2498135 RepID=A0A4P6PVK0_9ACTN|nr:membrane protein insertase YidC [Streptomonospora litoralis]QBI52103.1 Membrane protein insertase YidC [Streptomonospora litoralis]